MDLDFYVASDFEKVPDIPTSSGQLHLSLLAMVGQTGNLTDDFRLVITGPKEVQMEFLGDDFYPHPAPLSLRGQPGARGAGNPREWGGQPLVQPTGFGGRRTSGGPAHPDGRRGEFPG